MKLKALGIFGIVGLFAGSLFLSSSALAGDHKKKHRHNDSYVTKRVVIKETPRSTKRIVTTTYKAKDYRHNKSYYKSYNKSHRKNHKQHYRDNYRTNYHRAAPHVITERVVVHQPVQRRHSYHRVDTHNGLGLLVGGIVLGSILTNH